MIIGLLKKISHTYLTHASASVEQRDALLFSYFLGSSFSFVYLLLEDYDEQQHLFSTYWIHDPIQGIYINMHTPCNPDVIWNMCAYHTYLIYKTLTSHHLICSEHIAQVSDNKLHTYEFLSAYQPHSVLLSYFLKHPALQEQFSTDVILKPIYGHGGLGIELLSKKEILENKTTWSQVGYVYIVQERVNGQLGYPGISTMNHDLRLYIFGNEIIDAVLREKQGSSTEFKVNVSQGGQAHNLEVDTLPQNLCSLTHSIIKTLQPKETDVYALDFIYDHTHTQRYLIEMNSNPGFRNTDQLPIKDIKILQALEKMFLKYTHN